MRNNYLLRIVTMFSLLLLGPAVIFAEDLPFGVSPKQIFVTGSIDMPEKTVLGYQRDKLSDDYVYEEGNRIGVELGSIDYSLTFWNVGKMGGTSGYLFWKKDFSRANLELNYNIIGNGQLITEKIDLSKMKLGPGYKMEPAKDEPRLNTISCSLSFSGGPTGTFSGSCDNEAHISGRVGAGSFVVFDDIKQPENQKNVEMALDMIKSKDLRLNGEFGDWKFDESTLEDSGARFSSINGEVEVRHEKDTKWDFSKLDTKLYVLDHVKTGEESQAIIGFADLSTFLVKAESEIVVTTPPKKDSKIGLVWGTIKANVKKMVKDGTMEVEMSQAVAGIKGTRFIVTETGTTSTLSVTEGTVAFRSKVSGKTEMITAGQTITATKSGLQERAFFDATVEDEKLLTETSANSGLSVSITIKILLLLVVIFVIVYAVILLLKKRKNVKVPPNQADVESKEEKIM